MCEGEGEGQPAALAGESYTFLGILTHGGSDGAFAGPLSPLSSASPLVLLQVFGDSFGVDFNCLDFRRGRSTTNPR